MDEYVLRDDLIVECTKCGSETPTKISILETDNAVVCTECGGVRVIDVADLRRYLESMKEKIIEMQSGGALMNNEEKADQEK